MADVTTEKKKRGRPRKTPEAEPKKSEVKQFPLTFKCNSDLEMDLYDHLVNKYYRGAYIKEKLIREMFAERPDLAKKYGAVVSVPNIQPMPTLPQTNPPVEWKHDNVDLNVMDEDEPDPPIKEEVVEEPKEEVRKVKRGLNTVNLF